MKFQKGTFPPGPYTHIGAGRGFFCSVKGGDMDLCHWKLPPHESDYRGLPDNICDCPHYGYLLSGRIRIKYPDTAEEEFLEPGDVYYIPPRHVFDILEEVEVVEFSPHEDLARIMKIINRNAEEHGYPQRESESGQAAE